MDRVTREQVEKELSHIDDHASDDNSLCESTYVIRAYIDHLEQRVKLLESLLHPSLALVKDMRLTDLMIAGADLGYDYTKLEERIEAALAGGKG